MLVIQYKWCKTLPQGRRSFDGSTIDNGQFPDGDWSVFIENCKDIGELTTII